MKRTNYRVISYALLIYVIGMVTVIAPYLVGKSRWEHDVLIEASWTDGSDGEIKRVMNKYGFKSLDVFDEPTSADYVKAGIYSLTH